MTNAVQRCLSWQDCCSLIETARFSRMGEAASQGAASASRARRRCPSYTTRARVGATPLTDHRHFRAPIDNRRARRCQLALEAMIIVKPTNFWNQLTVTN